jgi:hypothetical protein
MDHLMMEIMWRGIPTGSIGSEWRSLCIPHSALLSLTAPSSFLHCKMSDSSSLNNVASALGDSAIMTKNNVDLILYGILDGFITKFATKKTRAKTVKDAVTAVEKRLGDKVPAGLKTVCNTTQSINLILT